MDPLVIARAVHIASTAVVAGVVFFQSFVIAPPLRPAPDDDPTAKLDKQLRILVWITLVIAGMSGLAWLLLLAARIADQGVIAAFANDVAWTVLTETRFGHVWMGRLAVVLVLAGILFCWPAWRHDKRLGRVVPLLAAGLLGSLAWSGHAGASPGLGGAAHLASDILHLVAAGAWAGTLPPLAMLLSSALQPANQALKDIAVLAVHRFSALGMVSFGTLIVTGTINTLNLAGTASALTETEYGRLLLTKISVFVAIFCIAAVNRLVLVPRIPDAQAVRRLRSNALIEIALGAAIILIVGALGTMPPGAHAPASHVH